MNIDFIRIGDALFQPSAIAVMQPQEDEDGDFYLSVTTTGGTQYRFPLTPDMQARFVAITQSHISLRDLLDTASPRFERSGLFGLRRFIGQLFQKRFERQQYGFRR